MNAQQVVARGPTVGRSGTAHNIVSQVVEAADADVVRARCDGDAGPAVLARTEVVVGCDLDPGCVEDAQVGIERDADERLFGDGQERAARGDGDLENIHIVRADDRFAVRPDVAREAEDAIAVHAGHANCGVARLVVIGPGHSPATANTTAATATGSPADCRLGLSDGPLDVDSLESQPGFG